MVNEHGNFFQLFQLFLTILVYKVNISQRFGFKINFWYFKVKGFEF